MTTRGTSGEGAPPSSRAGAPRPLLLLAILVVAVLAWAHRAHFVDDAFIGLRYVENLRLGHGFVFNPGDPPVEGVTNIGWTLLLAAVAPLLAPALAAKLAGAVLLIVGLALLATLFPRGRDAAGVAAAAPLLLAATCFDTVYFAVAGMETGLLVALVAAMAALAAGRRSAPALGVLAAAGFCVRPEAAAIPLLFALLRRDRHAITALAVAAFLIAFATLARHAAFGDWLPQPARAKSSSMLVMLANLREIATGSRAHLPFPLVGLPVIGLAIVGWRHLRADGADGADMLAAIGATGLLFATYALPDWTELARYAAPYAPVLILLAWTGFVALAGGRRATILPVLALLLVVAAVDHVAKTARADRFPGYVVFGTPLVEPARWIAANTPREAVIATRRIGAVGLFGQRRVFDYAVGLIDRDVAALFAPPERGIEDPNDPRLAELWAQRRPSHLLEDDDVIDRIARAAGGTRAAFTVQGETFRVVKSFPLGTGREWLLAARDAR
ncbi:MAG: DUF2029 domain-containing protein [Alphaproteobacteria bacterium]|nr:DUF2029 domain-containing protein [Alphaproteobacteria bacterium]